MLFLSMVCLCKICRVALGYEYDSMLDLATSYCRMEVQGLTVSMMMRCMHENHQHGLATTTVSLRLVFEHAFFVDSVSV
jgi:hypothetical protein